jgi:hypothetical protein
LKKTNEALQPLADFYSKVSQKISHNYCMVLQLLEKSFLNWGPEGGEGGMGVGGLKERIKTVYHFLSSLLIGLAFWKLGFL